MAPSTRTPTPEKNEKPRLRKPAVEKMRRDRINTGIERLKLLLKDKLNPKPKLEKADVLETAVAYLKQSKAVARASPEQCYADGFARCLEETARFLTVHNRVETGKHIMMSSLGHAIHPRATGSISMSVNDVKSSPECTGAVWRPW
ncbi:hypothetical protein PHYPO_G00115710 [Pangasianodon hypophthalmus]|uniref:BHLH domain-containing protein n=1 Tax=Pangasianodon hypophthalmus TaxID=310915 RepID=A0A5N5L347_PANHP|nr:transcription factor HES-5 [Pangasianodon hypophthalmus]KAB5537164.1 hypothetical protein PHYPO_G00115710 [Pangasianodon hypophthalmus]